MELAKYNGMGCSIVPSSSDYVGGRISVGRALIWASFVCRCQGYTTRGTWKRALRHVDGTWSGLWKPCAMFYLSKLLPLFVLPLGLTLSALLVGLVLRVRWLTWMAVVVLWISSSPAVGQRVMRAAEAWAERVPVTDVSHADAIVVLSSGRSIAPGAGRVSEWGDADRFFGGVELFGAGKAPLLVFTGAGQGRPDAGFEGEVLAEYAHSLGVPPDRILVTGLVRNTADEAQMVAATLGDRHPAAVRLLLVTSAFHMPRAQELFERTGLTVVPFPVDFRAPERSSQGLVELLPNVNAFVQTHTAMREMYGRLFYWLLFMTSSEARWL